MKAEMSKKVRLLALVFTRKDAVLGIDFNLNRPIDCGLSGIGAFRILSVWENRQEYALFNPTVAKILLMLRCNIKLHANLQPDQYIREEFIIGSVLEVSVKTRHSRMNKGPINYSIESFMQS